MTRDHTEPVSQYFQGGLTGNPGSRNLNDHLEAQGTNSLLSSHSGQRGPSRLSSPWEAAQFQALQEAQRGTGDVAQQQEAQRGTGDVAQQREEPNVTQRVLEGAQQLGTSVLGMRGQQSTFAGRQMAGGLQDTVRPHHSPQQGVMVPQLAPMGVMPGGLLPGLGPVGIQHMGLGYPMPIPYALLHSVHAPAPFVNPLDPRMCPQQFLQNPVRPHAPLLLPNPVLPLAPLQVAWPAPFQGPSPPASLTIGQNGENSKQKRRQKRSVRKDGVGAPGPATSQGPPAPGSLSSRSANVPFPGPVAITAIGRTPGPQPQPPQCGVLPDFPPWPASLTTSFSANVGLESRQPQPPQNLGSAQGLGPLLSSRTVGVPAYDGFPPWPASFTASFSANEGLENRQPQPPQNLGSAQGLEPLPSSRSVGVPADDGLETSRERLPQNRGVLQMPRPVPCERPSSSWSLTANERTDGFGQDLAAEALQDCAPPDTGGAQAPPDFPGLSRSGQDQGSYPSLAGSLPTVVEWGEGLQRQPREEPRGNSLGYVSEARDSYTAPRETVLPWGLVEQQQRFMPLSGSWDPRRLPANEASQGVSQPQASSRSVPLSGNSADGVFDPGGPYGFPQDYGPELHHGSARSDITPVGLLPPWAPANDLPQGYWQQSFGVGSSAVAPQDVGNERACEPPGVPADHGVQDSGERHPSVLGQGAPILRELAQTLREEAQNLEKPAQTLGEAAQTLGDGRPHVGLESGGLGDGGAGAETLPRAIRRRGRAKAPASPVHQQAKGGQKKSRANGGRPAVTGSGMQSPAKSAKPKTAAAGGLGRFAKSQKAPKPAAEGVTVDGVSFPRGARTAISRAPRVFPNRGPKSGPFDPCVYGNAAIPLPGPAPGSASDLAAQQQWSPAVSAPRASGLSPRSPLGRHPGSKPPWVPKQKAHGSRRDAASKGVGRQRSSAPVLNGAGPAELAERQGAERGATNATAFVRDAGVGGAAWGPPGPLRKGRRTPRQRIPGPSGPEGAEGANLPHPGDGGEEGPGGVAPLPEPGFSAVQGGVHSHAVHASSTRNGGAAISREQAHGPSWAPSRVPAPGVRKRAGAKKPTTRSPTRRAQGEMGKRGGVALEGSPPADSHPFQGVAEAGVVNVSPVPRGLSPPCGPPKPRNCSGYDAAEPADALPGLAPCLEPGLTVFEHVAEPMDATTGASLGREESPQIRIGAQAALRERAEDSPEPNVPEREHVSESAAEREDGPAVWAKSCRGRGSSEAESALQYVRHRRSVGEAGAGSEGERADGVGVVPDPAASSRAQTPARGHTGLEVAPGREATPGLGPPPLATLAATAYPTCGPPPTLSPQGVDTSTESIGARYASLSGPPAPANYLPAPAAAVALDMPPAPRECSAGVDAGAEGMPSFGEATQSLQQALHDAVAAVVACKDETSQQELQLQRGIRGNYSEQAGVGTAEEEVVQSRGTPPPGGESWLGERAGSEPPLQEEVVRSRGTPPPGDGSLLGERAGSEVPFHRGQIAERDPHFSTFVSGLCSLPVVANEERGEGDLVIEAARRLEACRQVLEPLTFSATVVDERRLEDDLPSPLGESGDRAGGAGLEGSPNVSIGGEVCGNARDAPETVATHPLPPWWTSASDHIPTRDAAVDARPPASPTGSQPSARPFELRGASEGTTRVSEERGRQLLVLPALSPRPDADGAPKEKGRVTHLGAQEASDTSPGPWHSAREVTPDVAVSAQGRARELCVVGPSHTHGHPSPAGDDPHGDGPVRADSPVVSIGGTVVRGDAAEDDSFSGLAGSEDAESALQLRDNSPPLAALPPPPGPVPAAGVSLPPTLRPVPAAGVSLRSPWDAAQFRALEEAQRGTGDLAERQDQQGIAQRIMEGAQQLGTSVFELRNLQRGTEDLAEQQDQQDVAQRVVEGAQQLGTSVLGPRNPQRGTEDLAEQQDQQDVAQRVVEGAQQLEPLMLEVRGTQSTSAGRQMAGGLQDTAPLCHLPQQGVMNAHLAPMGVRPGGLVPGAGTLGMQREELNAAERVLEGAQQVGGLMRGLRNLQSTLDQKTTVDAATDAAVDGTDVDVLCTLEEGAHEGTLELGENGDAIDGAHDGAPVTAQEVAHEADVGQGADGDSFRRASEVAQTAELGRGSNEDALPGAYEVAVVAELGEGSTENAVHEGEDEGGGAILDPGEEGVLGDVVDVGGTGPTLLAVREMGGVGWRPAGPPMSGATPVRGRGRPKSGATPVRGRLLDPVIRGATASIPCSELLDTCGGRAKRRPGGDPLDSAPFRRLIDMIRGNSGDFEASGRVLRLKQYMSADARPAMIDLVLDALAVNTRVECLYIQNFELGMHDEQLDHLTEVLKLKRIWAVNVGENFTISLDAWERFTQALPQTAVGYMYVSEHHLLRTDLKIRMRLAIRANRKVSPLPDPEVAAHVSNMWFNPLRKKKGASVSVQACSMVRDQKLAEAAARAAPMWAPRAPHVGAPRRMIGLKSPKKAFLTQGPYATQSQAASRASNIVNRARGYMIAKPPSQAASCASNIVKSARGYMMAKPTSPKGALMRKQPAAMSAARERAADAWQASGEGTRVGGRARVASSLLRKDDWVTKSPKAPKARLTHQQRAWQIPQPLQGRPLGRPPGRPQGRPPGRPRVHGSGAALAKVARRAQEDRLPHRGGLKRGWGRPPGGGRPGGKRPAEEVDAEDARPSKLPRPAKRPRWWSREWVGVSLEPAPADTPHVSVRFTVGCPDPAGVTLASAAARGPAHLSGGLGVVGSEDGAAQYQEMPPQHQGTPQHTNEPLGLGAALDGAQSLTRDVTPSPGADWVRVTLAVTAPAPPPVALRLTVWPPRKPSKLAEEREAARAALARDLGRIVLRPTRTVHRFAVEAGMRPTRARPTAPPSAAPAPLVRKRKRAEPKFPPGGVLVPVAREARAQKKKRPAEEARRPPSGAISAKPLHARAPVTHARLASKPVNLDAKEPGDDHEWPAGFTRRSRVTKGKPGGIVEFVATCPEHGESGGLDRVAKVEEYLKQHAQCRPEWKQWARKKSERVEAAVVRLREVFDFRTGKPRGVRASAALPASAPRPQGALGHAIRQTGTGPAELAVTATPGAALPHAAKEGGCQPLTRTTLPPRSDEFCRGDVVVPVTWEPTAWDYEHGTLAARLWPLTPAMAAAFLGDEWTGTAVEVEVEGSAARARKSGGKQPRDVSEGHGPGSDIDGRDDDAYGQLATGDAGVAAAPRFVRQVIPQTDAGGNATRPAFSRPLAEEFVSSVTRKEVPTHGAGVEGTGGVKRPRPSAPGGDGFQGGAMKKRRLTSGGGSPAPPQARGKSGPAPKQGVKPRKRDSPPPRRPAQPTPLSVLGGLLKDMQRGAAGRSVWGPVPRTAPGGHALERVSGPSPHRQTAHHPLERVSEASPPARGSPFSSEGGNTGGSTPTLANAGEAWIPTSPHSARPDPLPITEANSSDPRVTNTPPARLVATQSTLGPKGAESERGAGTPPLPQTGDLEKSPMANAVAGVRTPKPKVKGQSASPLTKKVDMGDLVRAGLIPAGLVTFGIGRDELEYDVTVTEEGGMVHAGVEYPSVSALALALVHLTRPRRESVNGWSEMSYEGQTLDVFRTAYLKQQRAARGSAPRTAPPA